MKTFCLSLILMFAGGTVVFSQVLVGPEVGVNYSWTSFRDDDLRDQFKQRPMIGFHAGGHLAFKVRNRFFLHASLLYSKKGRVLSSKYDANLKSDAHYHFIDMPINYTVDFRARIGKSKEFKYFLGIGPNVSYWLGGKGSFYNSELAEDFQSQIEYKIKFKEESADQPSDELRIKEANRLQLGLNLMAGIVFEPWRKQRFMFSLRFERGHSYLAKADGVYVGTYFTEPLKSRNQGFRISLTYLYDLKTEERKKGKSTIDRRNPK